MWRRVKQIILSLLALVVAVVVGGAVYLAYLGGIERIANDQIKDLFADKNNLEIKIGKIGGDLFSDLTLEDIDIFYVDPQHRYQMARIPRVKTRYSFANLWNRHYILDFLFIDSIDVTLRFDSTTGWQLPPLTRSQTKTPTELPAFAVDDVNIDHASLTLIQQEDTTRFDRIAFAAAVKGDHGTYSAELNRLEFDSDMRAVNIDAAEGKLTYADKNLVFSDFIIVSGDTRLRADGSVVFDEDPVGLLRFDGDNVRVEDIAHYINVGIDGILDVNGEITFVGTDFEGNMAVAGDFKMFTLDNLVLDYRFRENILTFDTLYGSIFNGCSIDGIGEIDFNGSPDRYWLDASVRNFDLKALVSQTFVSDLNGRIYLDGESFSNEELLLQLDVDLFESSFDGYPVHQALGHMTITTDSLVFADSFRVDYYENTFYAAGPIRYREDMDLRLALELNNLDRWRQTSFFIEEPGGRGYAEATLTGQTGDPDLHGWFVSDSAWIYGLYADTMYATIAIERFLTGRQGMVEVWFDSGQAWTLPYDSGFCRLLIDSHLVWVDSSSIANTYASLTSHALLDYESEPQLLEVSDMNVDLLGRKFVNPSPMAIEIDSLGFNFVRAAVGNEKALLSMLGRINYDESMDFLLAVDHLPIEPWLNILDATLEYDGLLSAEAAVNGTFAAPEFTLFAEVDSLTYRNLNLGWVVTGMDYDKQLLRIDSLRLYSNPGEYLAAGSLYVDLALTTEAESRFPRRPMSIKIDAADKRFDLVSLLLPSVEQLDGDFWADFTLFGNPSEPHIEGEAYIKNARLKYFDLENPIYVDSGGVTMHDDSISIENIEIYASEGERINPGSTGKITAYNTDGQTIGYTPTGRRYYGDIEGAIRLLEIDSLYYDVEVTLHNEFPFSYELDDIRGKVEGDLWVEGATPPTVYGEIQLISAQYRVPFADEKYSSSFLAALTTEDPWDLDIEIEILSNYWIKNEDIDAEFSGFVNLIREEGAYRFIGEMEIVRGRGFLFDKTFRLDPGSRVVFEGNDTLNPRLDISGYTRVSAVRAAEEDGPASEQIELCIHIGGTLEAPEINPCGGSDFSRADILPLIVANYYGGDGVEVSGQIEDRLFGLGYAQVSQIGGRQLNQIGVETFEIDPVYGEELDPWNAWVTLGGYLPFAANLYVYGRSTLAGQTRQEAGFEYRLNKQFLVEGRRDEDNLYHLNLRLHWEF